VSDTNNAEQATGTGLRDVPRTIDEYRKFVESKGNEHNAAILDREDAVAAAKAAGIEPVSAPGNEAEVKKTQNRFQRRVARLNQTIGAKDAEITELRKRLEAHEKNGAKPNGAPAVPAKSEAGPAKAAATADAKPEKKEASPRPKEEDFKTYSEFVEALTEWKTDRKIEERESRRADERERARNESKSKEVLDAHNARVDGAKKRYADWDKAFKGLDNDSFSDPMVVYIFESERGPDVTYYLATHRDELDRIRGLSPLRQAAALGRIEDRLEAAGDKDKDGAGEDDKAEDAKDAKPAKDAKAAAENEDEDEDEEPQPRRKSGASKAPPPAKPLGGKGGADDAMPDPKDFKSYEAWSKRQAAKGVKRNVFAP
jgi:hypothetical protein